MGNYLDGIARVFEDSDFLELTYYAIGVLVAIVAVIIIAMVLKATINRRIRKIQNFSMDLDDLKKMQRTGLISEEEYKKMKSSLIKRYTRETMKEPSGSGAESPLTSPDREIPVTGRKNMGKSIIPTPSSPPEKSTSKPIDIDVLLKKGLISKEEYQKLSHLSQSKKNE